MYIHKEWAMPNGNTFKIEPIRRFVESSIYNIDGVIIDPFANNSKYANITNDLNPEFNTDYHLDALEFLKQMESNSADVVLYDPPYSFTQASELYKNYGRDKLEVSATNMKYWSLCKDHVARITKPNGIVLCFGWNSNGLGINRGFKMTEILMVAHGGSKNDTICTKERKIQTNLF